MSLKVSWSSLVRGRVVARLIVCTMLACGLAACGGREQQQEERARRARQMRDVSRMLDAMEAQKPAHEVTALAAAAPPVPSAAVEAAAPLPQPSDRNALSLLTTLATAVSGGFAASALATFAWRRRKKRPAAPAPEPPSIADCFAVAGAEEPPAMAPAAPAPAEDPPAAPVEDARGGPPLTWVYRSSPFETPRMHMIAEPVDLLLPREYVEAAVASGFHAALAGRNARMEAALDLPRRECDAALDELEGEAAEALHGAAGEDRALVLAQLLRIRLARAEKLSGATRLFALRNLLASVTDDEAHDAPAVLDARIDAQLAWASWAMGDAAASRLAEAERLCDLLAAAHPAARALALRRRGEAGLRRAALARPPASLRELHRAQALFDESHALAPEPRTALFVAQTALRRAHGLPPADAVGACSHALVHAFLAEQDPACRGEALACRLDIQLLYETLPDHEGQDGVSASLGRSLEASGPLPPASRVALAELRLRDGDVAAAAHLCESLWRDGHAGPRVLELWRDACTRWAGADRHDARALARSLRQLAIARSTL
jgi:hypothetical protein